MQSSDELSSNGQEKRVMCVGLVCIDIINIVRSFPTEDSDQRCVDSLWQKGGNAANTASVLSILRIPSEFLGTMASKGPYTQFIKNDFEQFGVLDEWCPMLQQSECPVSTVIISQATGSRTIIHTNKRLPELLCTDFQKVPLSEGLYSWIHFEGRPNMEEIRKMLLFLEDYNSSCDEANRVVTSLEIEKVVRANEFRCMIPHADYVFVSKDVAMLWGFSDAVTAVENLVSLCKQGAAVICPWGEQGAAAKRKDSPAVTSPAFPPEAIVDTLGAGDTFNAATISALNSGKDISEAIRFGCRVAGAKCGMLGFSGLMDIKF